MKLYPEVPELNARTQKGERQSTASTFGCDYFSVFSVSVLNFAVTTFSIASHQVFIVMHIK